jgi:hypothetical protein
MEETDITSDTIRAEHQASVDPARHWVYLITVLLASLGLMLLLMLFLEQVA